MAYWFVELGGPERNVAFSSQNVSRSAKRRKRRVKKPRKRELLRTWTGFRGGQ